MDTRKKARLINAIEQIASEQGVAIHQVIGQLNGVVFSDEEARELWAYYQSQF